MDAVINYCNQNMIPSGAWLELEIVLIKYIKLKENQVLIL